MRTGAVIVAAGLSSRMGDFKPLMQVGSMSIISRVIANFQQADIFPIVVVTGFRAAEIEKHVAKLGVICVRNPDYATTEMVESAKIGFSFIKGKCSRVFFTPGDIPMFNSDTVERLLQTKADVAKPVCQGHDGHPVLLKNSLMEKILKDPHNDGMKNAIARYAKKIDLIDVKDEGILLDADTKEEYNRLVEFHNRKLFRPVLDVSLMQEGLLFDKEAALLLQMVAFTGTVKGASEKMGISYSKAWKRIAALEKNLGFPLLERQPGGEAGGMSTLTEEGQRLLNCYGQYVGAIKKFANENFSKYFKTEK
jgi:molybdate transport repressor ModE-like protein